MLNNRKSLEFRYDPTSRSKVGSTSIWKMSRNFMRDKLLSPMVSDLQGVHYLTQQKSYYQWL